MVKVRMSYIMSAMCTLLGRFQILILALPAAAVPPVTNHFERRDGDATRMRAYREALTIFRQEVFGGQFGGRQMSLRLMCTHPDYWRRGAAHLIVKWGVENATEAGVAISLFASPMGRKVYAACGFRELGIVSVHVPREEESLRLSGMAWDKTALER